MQNLRDFFLCVLCVFVGMAAAVAAAEWCGTRGEAGTQGMRAVWISQQAIMISE